MRILHTSDWHLGRSFHRVGMLDAQAAVIDHLVEVVRAERVDAVVVAGDVYDRALPGVDVVALLDEALARLAGTGATVLLSSGNHDSPRRLGFAARLLEHSRVMYFRWGRSEADEALFLSSADWMSRNMFRRIEIAWPVRDPALRQRVIDECLMPYLHDRQDSWQLNSDGGYERVSTDGPSAQQALMERYT